MTALDHQLRFEAAGTGQTALAIFMRLSEPPGRGTREAGANLARYFTGLLEGAGVNVGSQLLHFTADGVIAILTVSDASRALSEIWGALSRADSEDRSWVAELQPDGHWLSLIPTRGQPVTLPPEIQLLPKGFYDLESQFQQLKADSEGLADAVRLGTVEPEDAETMMAGIVERRESIAVELAKWKRKLTGLEGQS